MEFKDLSLRPEISQALATMGFTTPTEIQAKAIPILLQEQSVDFHGQAQTGTGKTLAFGIPLLNRIDVSNKATQALIVAPTRELVLQICQSLNQVASNMNINILSIYGGMGMHEQIRGLKKGAQIVVGTPGRLNDHLRRGTLSLKQLSYLVLDEADIMLEMGFKQEVDEILSFAPAQRRIWLFSATVKPGIDQIMKTHMHQAMSVRVSKQQVSASGTKQYFAIVPQKDRMTALSRFIDAAPAFYGFVFCQTKMLTAQVAEQLMRAGYAANALHGDMSQAQRNRVIGQFKDREFTILVCTDVAARGIDVSDVTHVINFSLPEDQESYIHRVGRTGRAGKEGVAISFVSAHQVRYIKTLERKFKVEIQPLNVPTFEQIAHVKVSHATDHLKTIINPAEKATYYGHKLRQVVQTFDKEELINALTLLLEQSFCKDIKAQESVQFAPVESFSTDTNNGDEAAEVTIYLGLDDGITQEDVEEFLQENKVNQDDIVKLRVIKKRIFIKVEPAMAETVINAVKGKTLQGHKVRAALSVDHGYEPRRQERRGGRSDRPERSRRMSRRSR